MSDTELFLLGSKSQIYIMSVSPMIVAADCTGQVTLVVGTNAIGVTRGRINGILKAGASAVVVNPSDGHVKGLLGQFGKHELFQLVNRKFELSDLTRLGRPVVAKVVDRVFVNLAMDQWPLAKDIYDQCVKLRIPVNTLQRPEYSTFHLLSTYTDPKGSGLQIAVTTNGQGCLLANRIKREIVSSLPGNISEVVSNMGSLRNHIINEDQKLLLQQHYQSTSELAVAENGWYGLADDGWESHKLNTLVHEFDMTEREQKLKRTRWLSQVMEYYPLSKLADLSLEELENKDIAVLKNKATGKAEGQQKGQATDIGMRSNDRDQKSVSLLETQSAENIKNSQQEKGSISLVGSGPGSISMLTLGALQEIKRADLILADKLVPQAVLDLIPSTTETFIARKFPGNAERAQEELLEKGLAGLENGLKVVRLKQGDPFIFGRGGEEYSFFTQHGYQPIVLPGLSSSLASTVVSNIPATQRDVADQVLICTGTGRKGALPVIPEYVPTRTTIFLMALHRAVVLIEALDQHNWDLNTPAAIIERASCKDQRVTRTLLKYVPEVVEEIGSRPPGLLVVGKAVTALLSKNASSFDDSNKYSVEEGYQTFSIDSSLIV